ncbi:hypothetical protein LQ424_29050 [Rhodococcus qingshengii]|uniref:hypothetical protein n=1 Tax=Rhodococcus qingshengii TaxID=334542 RepID=UPI001E62C19B|nr:hypothetical protein [Rhodococcus qingshengii]MCD2135875.1 hypothetical protein [Rhodococcus qingshengii]
MAILRRLLAVALAAVALMLVGGGIAFAQDRPSVPPPSEGPALNLPVQDGQNGFQKTFEECKNNIPDDMEGVEKWMDEHIGFINWANEAANNVSCTMDATDAHPGDAFSTLLTNAASTFWDDPVGKLTKAVMEGNVAAFSTVMTFWMSVPIPGLTGGEAMSGIRNLTWEIQLVAFVIGMIVAAAKLAIARQQAVAEGADETAKMLTRTVFSAGLLPTLVIIFHLIGDVFSTWVLQQASGGDLNAKITGIAWVDEKTGLGPVLALVLTGLGLLGSVAQLIALLVREAVLAIVVGLAPVAAAQSATGTGRQSWSTMMGFVIAALLFKPVASLFYVFAFWTASSNVVSSAVIGSVLLAVAGLSLPSLMKAIGPVDAGGGGGAQQAAAMAGATGAVIGSAAALGSRSGSSGVKAGGAGGGSGGGGGGAAGSKGSPASGARSSYGGRFSSGGASGARSAAVAAGRSLGRVGAGVAGAVGAGTRTAATAAGALGRGAASAGQAASQGTAAAANIASGAVGNYHGQIPR